MERIIGFSFVLRLNFSLLCEVINGPIDEISVHWLFQADNQSEALLLNEDTTRGGILINTWQKDDDLLLSNLTLYRVGPGKKQISESVNLRVRVEFSLTLPLQKTKLSLKSVRFCQEIKEVTLADYPIYWQNLETPLYLFIFSIKLYLSQSLEEFTLLKEIIKIF